MKMLSDLELSYTPLPKAHVCWKPREAFAQESPTRDLKGNPRSSLTCWFLVTNKGSKRKHKFKSDNMDYELQCWFSVINKGSKRKHKFKSDNMDYELQCWFSFTNQGSKRKPKFKCDNMDYELQCWFSVNQCLVSHKLKIIYENILVILNWKWQQDGGWGNPFLLLSSCSSEFIEKQHMINCLFV